MKAGPEQHQTSNRSLKQRKPIGNNKNLPDLNTAA